MHKIMPLRLQNGMFQGVAFKDSQTPMPLSKVLFIVLYRKHSGYSPSPITAKSMKSLEITFSGTAVV